MSDKAGESSTCGDKAKPFQLRPSAFSSSPTLGSSATKGFVLRPSALGAIADQIEKKQPGETRKRPADSTDDDKEETKEGSHDNKKVKENDEAASSENVLQLTEPLQRPTGIGMFGFGSSPSVSTSSSTTTDPAESQRTNGTTTENYFLQTSTSRSSGFVFGQQGSSTSTGFNSLAEESISSSQNNSQASEANEVSSTTAEPTATDKESLLKVAGEHMKKIDNKSSLQEIEVTDGEEGERNVLQMQCKVHIFNAEKKIWVERGRGMLKLNDICQSDDIGVFQSRLVFRMQGSFSVVINTKLWPDMRCEKVNEKSLRLTGMDTVANDGVIVFLVTATKKDILQLYTAVDRRLVALKRNQDTQQNQSPESTTTYDDSSTTADRFADDDDDDDDDDDEISPPHHQETATTTNG